MSTFNIPRPPTKANSTLNTKEYHIDYKDSQAPVIVLSRSVFLIPKSQVFQDLLDHVLVFYHTDYFHRSGAFWARQGVHFVKFLYQADPVSFVFSR